MSKNSFFKIIISSIVLTFGSQGFAYTVQEAVSNTLATSPDFLMSTNTRDMVDKQLRESYAGYLPTLEMNAGAGEQFSDNLTTRVVDPLTGSASSGTLTLYRTEFGLLANQMLFDGFAVYHDVQGHKARVRAESWRVNGSAQDTALGAIETYLKVILERELVELAKQNLASHERIYAQIQKRSEGGIGRKADLDQAEARLALARINLLTEEANLQDANTDFLRRIGIPTPHHLVTPEAPHPFPATENEAIEIGLLSHPVLRASVEDTEVVREEYKGAKSPFSPRFDLQLGYDHNHNIDGGRGPSDDAFAMVRMRWNLFNGGKDLATICEKAYKMQEAQEVENRAHRQVIETVRKAWTTFSISQRQIPSLKEHVEASLRTREAYQKQFNIGQRTLLDLLDSENELFGARINLAKGYNDILFGQFRVMNSTGQLTHYLRIALPRQAEPRPTAVMDGRMPFFNKKSTLFDK